ncbi:hypothetical protein MMC11_000642 [Xylographa trunciseda]|nr:hypothetical protein [Xylographa trunciseda]
MSSPSWAHAAECWTPVEEAVELAKAPVIVSLDTEFWCSMYLMYMIAVYIMLLFGWPVMKYLSDFCFSGFLTRLRSGVRSLDIVERFEMNTRLQMKEEEIWTKHVKILDKYSDDNQIRVDSLEKKLATEKRRSQRLQSDSLDAAVAHAAHVQQLRQSMDTAFRNQETLVPEWQPFEERVDIYEISTDGTMGKLVYPIVDADLGASETPVPEGSDDNRNDMPQDPPSAELERYQNSLIKAVTVPDDADLYVPPGDNANLQIDYPVLPANISDEPEDIPSLPDNTHTLPDRGCYPKGHAKLPKKRTGETEAEDIPPRPDNLHAPPERSFFEEGLDNLQEGVSPNKIPPTPVHTTGRESAVLPTSPDDLVNLTNSGYLQYPRLDGSSTGLENGSIVPNLPDQIRSPVGTSYGLNPADFMVDFEIDDESDTAVQGEDSGFTVRERFQQHFQPNLPTGLTVKTKETSVDGTALVVDPIEEDIEKQITFHSDSIMTMASSASETILARRPRYRLENQVTDSIDLCQLNKDVVIISPQMAGFSMEDEMACQIPINTVMANQINTPMDMTLAEDKTVAENDMPAVSNCKEEVTYPENCTAPENEAIVVETPTQVIEDGAVPKVTPLRADCSIKESSACSDRVAARLNSNVETTIAENFMSKAKKDISFVEEPVADPLNSTMTMIDKNQSVQDIQELATTPSMEVSAVRAADQTIKQVAKFTAKPSAAGSGLPESLPDEMTLIAEEESAEKPDDDLTLASTARPLAKPVPFAQRRGTSSKAPTTVSSLVTLTSQPRSEGTTAATRPSSLIECQESLPPQFTASHLDRPTAAPLCGSTTKPQPQLGPARRPKKAADPFIRKKPARKTQDRTPTQVSSRGTTSALPGKLSTRNGLADEISTKRGPSQSDPDEGHNPIGKFEDPAASKDDSNTKRVRTSLLASGSITSTSMNVNNEGIGSIGKALDAPALFEERALEAARIWTPLQDLTEDQFYQRVDECTMMKNFGAFADFDFAKLLKQCHWTTMWLNEQNMTGYTEVLFEKTQLRRTADYVQKLCAAFLEGKVKNRKNRKVNGDKVEVITMIDGTECRGFRALTHQESRDRDEELDSEVAVDVENIEALMKWAESVLILGCAKQVQDGL